MSSAYDKLRRILGLEREQNYRNRAVIGGLARFLTFWEKEARAEESNSPHTVPIDTIIATLSGYADLSLEARKQAVDGLLESLAREESHPAAAETAESKPVVGQPPEQMPPALAEVPAPGPAKARPAPTDKPTLDAPLSALKGISTVTEGRLKKLGLSTIRDLLYHIPRRYNDFSSVREINRLSWGDEVTIVGVVKAVKVQHTRSGQAVLCVTFSDGTGSIEARWFNQAYLEKRFTIGGEFALSGRVDEFLGRLVFNSPEWEPLQREMLHTGRLVPVYPLTEGLSARSLRRLTKTTLDDWAPRIKDPLPITVLNTVGLMDLSTALRQIHFPDSKESLAQARQRLCFDEFLLLQLGILRQRRAWRSQPGRAIAVPREQINALIAQLPFKLTGAQQRAIETILADLQRPVPMSRLLQGDVGSGKTVVAVVAMLAVARNGLQAAIMTPTSILAEQHYRTISNMLAGFPDVRCELLVGSLSNGEKQSIQRDIAEGRVHIVVGTHALIQSAVSFNQLGLVVVDEQHRFGVAQRGTLRAKGADFQPHLLAMSATPIPRTLALTIYGDLDISVLDELPPDRQQIVTAVRDRTSRERIYSFVDSQIKQGRQAFVICPLIEESENLEAKAAVAEYERLSQEVFPHRRVGLLHGRMNADEKEAIMASFKRSEIDILVSTAVVEVGIDVPNATVMLIEGAERFGLAQLHQFRGRVGRGEHKSYCILLSDDPSEESLKRLEIMETVHDGFVLAEKDLELRGPGDFLGVRQHGLPQLKVASLSDTAILEKARAEAIRLFEHDPTLSLPEHRLLAADVQRFWANQEFTDMREVTP